MSRLKKILNTDYNVRSPKIVESAIIMQCILLGIYTLVELIFDFPSTRVSLLAPFLGLSLLSYGAFKKNIYPQWQGQIVVAILFSLLQANLFAKPDIFHSIVYWFPFVPVVALIVSNMRSAQIWLLIVWIFVCVDALYCWIQIGSSYTVNIQVIAFLLTGLIFSLAAFCVVYLLNKLLGDAYVDSVKESDQVKQLKEKLFQYQIALYKIAQDPAVRNGQLSTLYQKVSMMAAQQLGISRVSIWLLEEAPLAIRRKFLYQTQQTSEQEEAILTAELYAPYFEAIREEKYIAADDALSHPATRGFGPGYLKPLGIFSLLDCPILADGKILGVICCEQQQQARKWSVEEILFVQSLADLISLAQKSHQTLQLFRELKSSNNQLLEKSNEIETMNEELSSLNEELSTLNESLEEQVKIRTSELEKQNTQLTEYAFINSHILRAPLSRILGLSQLIRQNPTYASDPQLINGLIASSEELDIVIRRISDLLYDGHNFSREDIKEMIARNLKEE
ncbi:GAF domain-containing protein [Cytophagales bacterium LB-30]|uniref:GAF domain-containing protein n=1 Tax=Shiella aurantiaca TaxID=3058365 RepID=A0ABT8F899_9BACT|nr:GAF domain-containing protein [Shiella aurantiaca]MDN4166464.1 GAF domain-containing protein [Shiella aurantiaca]